MRNRRSRLCNTILGTVLAVLLAVAVALTVFSEPLYERRRAAAIGQVLDMLETGTLAVAVDAGAYPVHGEEDAGAARDARAFDVPTAPVSVPDGRTALLLYGVLSVPELSLQLPLYYGTDTVALRFGVGVAAPADGAGPALMFGLRTGVNGRLLHDIDRLPVGSGVTVSHTDGTRTAYTVSAVRLIAADTLKKELATPPDGSTAAIVSNQPAGQTDRRIVVWLAPV